MATTNSQHVENPPTKAPKLRRERSVPKSLIEFQPDAVEIEKRSLPGGARWTLYTVIALITAAIVWACWAKVDRIVVSQGRLITHESPINIQAVASSVIREIHVKFGDVVHRGDILATLDPTLSDADVAKLEFHDDSLAAAIARLTAERDGVEFTSAGHEASSSWDLEARSFGARKREYTDKLATVAAERQKLKVQQVNNAADTVRLHDELKIQSEVYETIKKLKELKSESKLQVSGAELEKLGAERALEKSQSEREQLIQDLDVNSKREAEFKSEWQSKISTDLLAASRERDEVSEELTKARAIKGFVDLRVPRDLPSEEYVVLEVADRSAGSAPKPGESLFKLVPVNASLKAEIEIQAQDIGLVKIGNVTRIKLDAFSYQKHGALDGTLTTISEGAFQKGEAPASVTLYRAVVELGKTDKLTNMPAKYRLLPGMTVNAEIRVGDRRVIEYFLYPILRQLDSSIREP